MKWFKKKKQEEELTIGEVTNRIRGFILDSQIQDAHELSVILGCSSLSQELQEREEEESDKRVSRISYLIPLLYAHSHAIAEGATEYHKDNIQEELKNIPNELWLESRRTLEQLSMSSLMGSISQLVDMGLLEIPKERR